MEGGSGGVGKATKGHGHPGHGDAPATPPAPLPHPTMGHHNLGACSGQAQPSGRFAQTDDEVGRLHGQPRAAKKPQQGAGAVGQLGCHSNILGWVKRPQGQPQARQERVRAATEPQEMRAVAQPPEAKVCGAAKPPLQVAQPL